MGIYSRVCGTGSYLPKRIVSNAELEERVQTSDQWIRERTGILQRHIAADDETTCSLACRASERAMEAAQVRAEDIDLIILATTTPDKVFPSTACLLQKRMGLGECPAFDVQAVCTGFIYALDIGNRFIKTGGAKCALIIGAEVMSRILDWSDRSTCVLFGDGAGAVVLKTSDSPGIYSTHLHADGRYEELLYAVDKVKMKGSEVFKIAVKTLGQIVAETLQANNFTSRDIDWLIPHQANSRILAATAKKLNISLEQVVMSIAKHANTSAASIPLALDEAVRDGRIRRGQNLLLEAFGGGFTWGSALLRF